MAGKIVKIAYTQGLWFQLARQTENLVQAAKRPLKK